MRYTEWMEEAKKKIEEAKRGIVKKALKTAQSEGLRDPHHFYITFRTRFPGVNVPPELQEEYPEEMTIVVNDTFWNLVVEEDYFSLDLLFDNKKKTLRIPYKALMNFIDPGVEFVLQLDWESIAIPVSSDNVIFLSSFRKE